ncbi:MAG: His/Gly/Thr/Pro-type tRNA ligase C-terminal domain-containing protein [archaeon]
MRSATAGTPYAVTVDYDSIEKKDVTIRDRDSEKQIRVKIKDLRDTLSKLLNKEVEFGVAGRKVG